MLVMLLIKLFTMRDAYVSFSRIIPQASYLYKQQCFWDNCKALATQKGYVSFSTNNPVMFSKCSQSAKATRGTAMPENFWIKHSPQVNYMVCLSLSGAATSVPGIAHDKGTSWALFKRYRHLFHLGALWRFALSSMTQIGIFFFLTCCIYIFFVKESRCFLWSFKKGSSLVVLFLCSADDDPLGFGSICGGLTHFSPRPCPTALCPKHMRGGRGISDHQGTAWGNTLLLGNQSRLQTLAIQ